MTSWTKDTLTGLKAAYGREIRAYFATPLAYVFIAIFLMLVGVFLAHPNAFVATFAFAGAYLVADLVVAPSLGDLAVAEQRRPPEGGEVDVDDAVLDRADLHDDPGCGVEFERVALAVAEAHRERVEALVVRDGETGGRVEATGEQDDGGAHEPTLRGRHAGASTGRRPPVDRAVSS